MAKKKALPKKKAPEKKAPEKKKFVPVVAVDLDGCLADYDGWKGIEHIGNVKLGARRFLKKLQDDGYNVVIFSTRTCTVVNEEGRTSEQSAEIIRRWMKANDLPECDIWTGDGKPIAVAYVDDRAVYCDGTDWERVLGEIRTLHDRNH